MRSIPKPSGKARRYECHWDTSKAIYTADRSNSQFWKQFFEASANVSLSGYEEVAADESATQDETQDSHGYDDVTADDTVTDASATPPRPTSSHADDELDSSILSSPSLAHNHSTPRAPKSGKRPQASHATTSAKFADYPSPYEALKRELHGRAASPGPDPTTPGKPQALPDMSMTPESSPFMAPNTQLKGSAAPTNEDPLFHRVLDKTYRIAATPHTGRKQKASVGFTPGTATRAAPSTRPAPSRWDDDSSPITSPAPQLRAEIFSSPMKAPRTPGVTVQRTPACGLGNSVVAQNTSTTQRGMWDSDSDEEDDGLGFSPPKTMQFHVPQSRLLQTPGMYSPTSQWFTNKLTCLFSP